MIVKEIKEIILTEEEYYLANLGNSDFPPYKEYLKEQTSESVKCP